MNDTGRPVRPASRRLSVALLVALLAGVGGVGLFASLLAVTSPGNIGSGSTPISASCDNEITVTPGPTAWSDTYGAFMLDEVLLSGVSVACDGSILTLIVGAQWVDPDAGLSGTDVLLIHSLPVAVSGAETQAVPFLADCDLDADDVVDPGCTPGPVPVSVEDFDQVAVLIQDDPATTDDPDLPGDAP